MGRLDEAQMQRADNAITHAVSFSLQHRHHGLKQTGTAQSVTPLAGGYIWKSHWPAVWQPDCPVDQ